MKHRNIHKKDNQYLFDSIIRNTNLITANNEKYAGNYFLQALNNLKRSLKHKHVHSNTSMQVFEPLATDSNSFSISCFFADFE